MSSCVPPSQVFLPIARLPTRHEDGTSLRWQEDQLLQGLPPIHQDGLFYQLLGGLQPSDDQAGDKSVLLPVLQTLGVPAVQDDGELPVAQQHLPDPDLPILLPLTPLL